MRILAIAIMALLLHGCTGNQQKIRNVAYAYFQAISERDQAGMIKLVYPPLVEAFGSDAIADWHIHAFSKRYRILSFLEFRGPFHHQGKSYTICSMRVKKGRPIGRKLVFTFLFVSYNETDWYIVPIDLHEANKELSPVRLNDFFPKEALDWIQAQLP